MPPHPLATIRPAMEFDVPAILNLIRELAEYEKLSHASIATEELLQKHLFGPDRAAEALVATIQEPPPSESGESGGGGGEGVGVNSTNDATVRRVIAYAIYFKTFSTFLALPGIYLEDLYVQPNHRRQGIGRAMLHHLAQLALARGYGRLEWSVLDWNSPAITFYKSLGAAPLDDWTMFRLTGDALTKFSKQSTPSI